MADPISDIKLYQGFQAYGGLKPFSLYWRYRSDPHQILRRRELGIWLNAQGLIGTGAEIGVKEGKYSERILFHWKGSLLYSIDPWCEFSAESYIDKANVAAHQHETFLAESRQRLSRFGDRSKILRLTSAEGAKEIPDGSLDFAYLDAQHHYAAVVEDIELWFPKIKPGGLLCGHDYEDGTETDPDTGEKSVFEVKRAVDEFAARDPKRILFATTKDKRKSWFIRKPV